MLFFCWLSSLILHANWFFSNSVTQCPMSYCVLSLVEFVTSHLYVQYLSRLWCPMPMLWVLPLTLFAAICHFDFPLFSSHLHLSKNYYNFLFNYFWGWVGEMNWHYSEVTSGSAFRDFFTPIVALCTIWDARIKTR